MSPRNMEIYVLSREINRLIKAYKERGSQPNVWNMNILRKIKEHKEHLRYLRSMANDQKIPEEYVRWVFAKGT